MAFNLKTLTQKVHNEVTAIKFLQNVNVVPNSKTCENGHNMKIVNCDSKPPFWRCNNRSCKTISIRKGTWLENSRLSFQNLLLFIYFWSREMASCEFCKHELDMNKNTVTDWNNYLREVCVWRLEQCDTMIGGDGNTVEIGKNLFVRGKNNERWIFGGICKETKDCFIVKIPDRTAETILPIVKQKIKPGTTIVSDSWHAYSDISSLGFTHKIVNHQLDYVEDMWGSVQCANKRRRGTDRNFIDSYLSEFLWRNKIDKDPFQAILDDIVSFWSTKSKI